jgi:hypothetical protein
VAVTNDLQGKKLYDVEYAWEASPEGRIDNPHTRRVALTDRQLESFTRAVDLPNSSVSKVTEVTDE